MPTGRAYVRFRRKTESHGQAVKVTRMTQLGLWMFGRIFRLDGREAIANCGWSRYAALTVQAEAAPHERGYLRRKYRF
jgi:hypothetical protein